MTPDEVQTAHMILRGQGYTCVESVPLGVEAHPALGVVLEFGSVGHEQFLKVGLVECLSRDRLRISAPDWVAGRSGRRSTFGPGFIARRVWTRLA